jgi:glycyl-tRNA synthetase beta chain
MFALGLIPSGSKDPFALRRQANGIVKIIAEHKLAFRLTELMQDARCGYQGSEAEQKFKTPDYVGSVNAFLRERVEFYLRDVRGFPYDVVNAVLAAGWDDLVDAIARAEAVAAMRSSTDFESISVAFKRIKNILQQAAENKRAVADAIQPNLLSEPAERELAEQVPEAAKQVEALRSQKDYRQALAAISSLRPRVDKFFDKVMVMVDDDAVRANRLALLQNLLREFSTIADFSEIVTEGKV